MHLLQQCLDLVELVLHRLQALSHADQLGAARQVHRQQIFLHQLAELLLRARRNAAGLVHHLREFRRAHQLVAEGVEPLLHLANHRLPYHGRVVALVGHVALLHSKFERLSRFGLFVPYDTVAVDRSTARRAQRRRGSSALRQSMA